MGSFSLVYFLCTWVAPLMFFMILLLLIEKKKLNKLWLEEIVNKGYRGYSLRKVITEFTDSSCLKGIGMYLKASLMARDSGKP